MSCDFQTQDDANWIALSDALKQKNIVLAKGYSHHFTKDFLKLATTIVNHCPKPLLSFVMKHGTKRGSSMNAVSW